MLGALARSLFGTANDRIVKGFDKPVAKINALEPEIAKLSDEQLRAKTTEFRERLAKGETLDNLLVEAFATVREAAKRTLGQRHFDVQLKGGMVLHQGKIAEMKTGEGKTLVATLPVYLNALEGKGVHVVTVNDYLANRDSEWMGQIYEFLGLTVGVIVHEQDDEQRKAAYACDVTYGTNNEIGFDYLRDNMKYRVDAMVQRPFNYAIVDEVNSILIDEARTPLIISGPAEDSSELYRRVDTVIPRLGRRLREGREGPPVDLHRDRRRVGRGDPARRRIAARRHQPLCTDPGDGAAPCDAGTARPQAVHARRRLHGARRPGRDHRRVHRSRHERPALFRRPAPGARSQGKGRDPAREPDAGLDHLPEPVPHVSQARGHDRHGNDRSRRVRRDLPARGGRIPTNVPVGRKDADDEIYRTLGDKTRAIVKLIKECQARNQPMLVGTVSIEKSEALSEALKQAGITHSVLNARYHEQEAQIVAQAGRPGTITIATNMAGRGTDIQLGGNVEMLVRQSEPEITARIADEAERKAEIARVEAEIAPASSAIARSCSRPAACSWSAPSATRAAHRQPAARPLGRQGDPGASRFFLSLEDDLMRIFGNNKVLDWVQKKGMADDEALTHRWLNKALETAQGKVEARNFEIRKNLLRFDDVMNSQRKEIYKERIELMATEDVSDTVAGMRRDVVDAWWPAPFPKASMPSNGRWPNSRTRSGASSASTCRSTNGPRKKASPRRGQGPAERHRRLFAQKVAQYGPEVWRQVEKSILMQLFDQSWKDHLLHLDHLRQGIGLRAYGQKDPLNEYKREAFNLFSDLLTGLREQVVNVLANLQLRMEQPPMRSRPRCTRSTRIRRWPRRRRRPGVRSGRSRRRRGHAPSAAHAQVGKSIPTIRRPGARSRATPPAPAARQEVQALPRPGLARPPVSLRPWPVRSQTG